MKTVLVIILIAAGFAAGFGYGRWYGPRSTATAAKGERRILYYVDPMHPAYKSDKPGIAPDCGMKLEPVYADGAPAAAATAERRITGYRDPKAPSYTSDKPGINPETGNDLEPVYAADANAMPPGTIEIAPDKQQLIGVKFGTVEYTTAADTVRSVGKVAIDETRVVRVHPKLDGWIEKVFVDFTGATVRKGDPLLTLYSPDMLASQKEYLLALKAREVMKNGAIHSALESSDSLVEASRHRLELWDLGKPQIDELERTGKPVRSITVFSPASGFVLARNSFANQRITPETELYAIADLSRVWIMADVFEADLPRIRPGQSAVVNVPFQAGGSFNARVNYIQPQVDPQTRTIKVRLEAPNARTALKPDMFVDVDFRVATDRRLTVPAEAVLDSGERKTVFVDRGQGHLEPRAVTTGDRIGERIVILSGLAAGDRIVTSANFLVDSESQLKSALSGMQHD